MNIYRLFGDCCHLGAIIFLLIVIFKTKSCAGISGKTQILLSTVFITRYLDLFIYFISIYNSVLKITFILTTCMTVFLIYIKYRESYDKKNDSFRIELLIVPAAILAIFVNHQPTLIEVFWTFSIYLEAVAIIPQMWMVYKTVNNVPVYIYPYIFALGLYRALYILNWAYRYWAEDHWEIISSSAGVVQTVPFLVFFCYVAIHYMRLNDDVGYDVKE